MAAKKELRLVVQTVLERAAEMDTKPAGMKATMLAIVMDALEVVEMVNF